MQGRNPRAANDGAGAPTAISSLEITSDPGDDGVYGVEDHIRVTVTFSEDVVVVGFPGLKVVIGDREAKARYESASGAEAVFAAWVGNIDLDTDGVSVKPNSLQMFGGSSIEDADGKAANLAHDGLDDDIDHRVGVTPLITGIEIVPPTRGTTTPTRERTPSNSRCLSMSTLGPGEGDHSSTS